MLKEKYGMVLIFMLSVSNTYSLREGNQAPQNNPPTETKPVPAVRQFKFIQYYRNSPAVTLYFATGHILNLFQGPTNAQFSQFQGVPNNFHEVTDVNTGTHPYYRMATEHNYRMATEHTCKKN